jgi:hypothetical protein
MKNFNLIMLSAGFEQGGNTLHRHLDGHPNLFVYPFESMMGTSLSSNVLDSYVPPRYRWPEFTTETTPDQAYDMMIDDEYKTFVRTPFASKFKNCGAEFDEDLRRKWFNICCEDNLDEKNFLGRKDFVEAYLRSAFASWKNLSFTGEETHFVGYCPTIVVETDKIMKDFPNAHIIHIVRNPFSGYADTLKRPKVVSIEKYCQTWNILQLYAVNYRNKYPNNFHIITYENFIDCKELEFKFLFKSVGIPYPDNWKHFDSIDSDVYPSFNGKELKEMYPWGTIKEATSDANIKTAKELSKEQKNKILNECNFMIDIFGYKWIYNK